MEEIVYSWNFHPLEVVYNENSLTNVVNVVHWQYKATHLNSGISIQNIGTIGLETPSSETFIPFDQLTKEIVTEWVETKLGEEAINNMKLNLSSAISSTLNPTKGSLSAPWDITTPP